MPTTNNNWPTPVATDLVKDGWEAIKDLGDAIDTTLGVYAPSTPGLTLINTTSFSAVSSVSLPASTFTSTYTNYALQIKMSNTAGGDFFVRLRSAGSDNTTSNYNYQGFTAVNTTLTGFRSTAATAGYLGFIEASTHFFDVTIFSPQETEVTNFQNHQTRRSGADLSILLSDTSFGATTSFDSLSFYPASGTITGTYSVFGFNK